MAENGPTIPGHAGNGFGEADGGVVYRAIVHSLRQPVVVLDRHLEVQFVNPAYHARFGDESARMVGRRVDALGDMWSAPELRRFLGALVSGEEGGGQCRFEVDLTGLGRRGLLVDAVRLDVTEHPVLYLVTVDDVTDARRSEQVRNLLLAELQHRVNNMLASVRALFRGTRRHSTTIEALTAAYEGRLAALARVHDLLVRAGDEQVSLVDLVHGELHAVSAVEGANYRIRGGGYSIDASRVQPLAMAIHELATNAARHGALTTPDGRIELSWRVVRREDTRHLYLTWREQGVPLSGTAPARGFGCDVIERGVPYMLGGTSVLGFRPDGVECRIVVPLGDMSPSR